MFSFLLKDYFFIRYRNKSWVFILAMNSLIFTSMLILFSSFSVMYSPLWRSFYSLLSTYVYYGPADFTIHKNEQSTKCQNSEQLVILFHILSSLVRQPLSRDAIDRIALNDPTNVPNQRSSIFPLLLRSWFSPIPSFTTRSYIAYQMTHGVRNGTSGFYYPDRKRTTRRP